MQKTCIKCGHVNLEASGADTDACPVCGAIYAKAQRTLARPAPAPAAELEPQSRPPSPAPVRKREPFIDRLRAESLYPTFRSLVRLFYVMWLLLAVVCLCSGVAALFFGEGARRILGPIFGLFFALFFYFIGKVSTEMSLMLADMSDATVRMAERGES